MVNAKLWVISFAVAKLRGVENTLAWKTPKVVVQIQPLRRVDSVMVAQGSPKPLVSVQIGVGSPNPS